jgi:hypothetical protein
MPLPSVSQMDSGSVRKLRTCCSAEGSLSPQQMQRVRINEKGHKVTTRTIRTRHREQNERYKLNHREQSCEKNGGKIWCYPRLSGTQYVRLRSKHCLYLFEQPQEKMSQYSDISNSNNKRVAEKTQMESSQQKSGKMKIQKLWNSFERRQKRLRCSIAQQVIFQYV